MNHGGLSSNSGMPNMQMPPSMQSSSGGMYDHMQPNVNINGVNMSPKADQSQMLQSQHLNPLPPQNQFLQSRNTSSVSNVPFSKNSITRSYALGSALKFRNEFIFRSQFQSKFTHFHWVGLNLIRCYNQIFRIITNFLA